LLRGLEIILKEIAQRYPELVPGYLSYYFCMFSNTKSLSLLKKTTVNDPTAKLWGILNCKDKGTPSPYNPCHSSPQQAEGYSGILL